ncbi:MAG: hypothetical protein IJO74_04720 [Clostridia bacterium]|nr:hypothetical protein [Clostridia bacterium]
MKKLLLIFISAVCFMFSACRMQTIDSVPAYKPAENPVVMEMSACGTPSFPIILADSEITAPPVINHFHNTEPDLISIGGKCEKDAVITIESDIETVVVNAYGEYFLGSVYIPQTPSETQVTITSKVQNKASAVPVVKTASYREGVYVNDGEWHILVNNFSQGFAKSTFADYEGTNLLTEAQLEAFRENITEKTDFLSQNFEDCQLIYMIVPNPLTIYDDRAPDTLKKAEGVTRLDQVIQTINSTDAVALDLRGVLKENRDNVFSPYLHTDSHWSEYGAYLGLGVLCDYISEKFPEAKIHPEEQYGFENRTVKGGDVIYYLNMNENLQWESAPFFNPSFSLPVSAEKYLPDSMRMDFNATSSRRKISTGNPSLPDCVVFRDSYGIALYEILPERFNNTRYYYTWGYNFDKKYISEANPDYVIYIIAERNIDNILK